MSTREGLGNHQERFYSASVISRPHIVRAEGVRYYDGSGAMYIDANAGAAVANIGPGNERVLQAMVEQGRRMSFSYVRFSTHDPNIELTSRIAELAGPGFERVHLSNDGSEANEMAIKLLRVAAYQAGKPAKRKVISLTPSYHGGTLGTMGWTGDSEYTAYYGDMMVPSTKIPAPLTYRRAADHSVEEAGLIAAGHLERAILELGPDNVLAFIMEPVGGTATGANVAPESYLRAVRDICTRHEVFLVFDEVMSATRTGKFLAAHHSPDVRPDAVVIAKGLGAGYVPLAATAVSTEFLDRLNATGGFDLSHTYNANPISCAAGCAVLDEMTDRGLIENGAVMGQELIHQLDGLAEKWPIIGDVRGRGLMVGVEIVADRATKASLPGSANATVEIRRTAMENGLLIGGRRLNGGAFGEFLMLTPALIITEAEIAEIVDRLDITLGAVTKRLQAAGYISN
ncbi:aminotransferase family protein [Rhodococcus sp. 114MFTsu3.1]|uniref:aminotransferase family protein n=1 Tax=Rhodococcus sp. 114MFTsu3.1 TaxID=1172184 RepID=UPI0003816272|nr:aminotransferase class III-fold pyridoxal phosphate-dependent enzyme [Rhodococcus sp. 114MFTsu3.1]